MNTMENFSSFILYSGAVFMFIITLISCAASLRALLNIFTRNQENVLQINFNRSFVELLFGLLMIWIWSGAALFSINKAETNRFTSNDQAISSGFVFGEGIHHFVGMENDSCDHVKRQDSSRPVFISLIDDKVFCGVSPFSIEDGEEFAFYETKNETYIRVGSWPFSYTLITPIKHDSL